jgi:RNA polymerase sigma-70 factor (ECF subfamily)
MGRGNRDSGAAPEPPGNDDDALVRRIAQGDARAWRDLVGRHLNAVVAMAWRIVGERAEAEDVAQEAFVRLMAKAPAWQPGGAPIRAWLARVAVNLAIDRKRAQRTAPLDEATETDEPDPGGVIGRRLDLERAVRGAMNGLPERQAAAVALVHFEGFTNQEAADMLEISVDALESLLARARRRLRDRLAAVAPALLAGE